MWRGDTFCNVSPVTFQSLTWRIFILGRQKYPLPVKFVYQAHSNKKWVVLFLCPVWAPTFEILETLSVCRYVIISRPRFSIKVMGLRSRSYE